MDGPFRASHYLACTMRNAVDSLLKLHDYSGQSPVLVLKAPAEFAPTMKELGNAATMAGTAGKVNVCGFAIVFAIQQQEVNAIIKALAPKQEGDVVLWFAYPKGTTKKFACDFNRDSGWTEVGRTGFEPVRQVAIDVDWSALRFRRVAFIKKMTRSFAMTEEGKGKAKKGR